MQLIDTAKKINQKLFEGIYCMYSGPNFETPAEINAEVDAMMMAATGEAPAATGVRVMTQEEMDRYSQAN